MYGSRREAPIRPKRYYIYDICIYIYIYNYMKPALHHRVAARYPAVWTEIHHDLHDIYEAEVVTVVRVVAAVLHAVREYCTSGPERSTKQKRSIETASTATHIWLTIFCRCLYGIVVKESEELKRPSQHLMITYII